MPAKVAWFARTLLRLYLGRTSREIDATAEVCSNLSGAGLTSVTAICDVRDLDFWFQLAPMCDLRAIFQLEMSNCA